MIYDTKCPNGLNILPCPFCGEGGELCVDFDGVYVGCVNKCCLVAPITLSFRSKRDAIYAWNNRGRKEVNILPMGRKPKLVN